MINKTNRYPQDILTSFTVIILLNLNLKFSFFNVWLVSHNFYAAHKFTFLLMFFFS
ncbi:unnamed protein product [Meloidogyne enterolobii]|uniref:Uncharacterized protein n=1 Tax=Meloidogyne enterolobii TaxID=390850 RepID=A0ACB1AMB4_MELEN